MMGIENQHTNFTGRTSGSGKASDHNVVDSRPLQDCFYRQGP